MRIQCMYNEGPEPSCRDCPRYELANHRKLFPNSQENFVSELGHYHASRGPPRRRCSKHLKILENFPIPPLWSGRELRSKKAATTSGCVRVGHADFERSLESRISISSMIALSI